MRQLMFASVCFVMLATTSITAAWPMHSGRANGSWIWPASHAQSLTSPQVQVPVSTPTVAIVPNVFSAPNAYPGSDWRAFSATSIWNTPIDASAKPDPNSARYMTAYNGQAFFSAIQTGYVDQSNDYSHAIYYGTAFDPTFKIVCTQSWADCSSFASTAWHVPSYAVPAGGSDHHLGVYDQTTGEFLSCWDASAPKNGILSAGTCNHSPITGPGIGENPGSTAAGFSVLAGIIRDQELIAGNIPHAIAIIAPCLSNTSVYPSIPRSAEVVCANGAPYGARLRLNMTSAQIAALPASRDQKTILTAAATYGMYAMDINNYNGFGMQFESDATYMAAGYKNSGCPTNGAACTPLTAYFHSENDPFWTGDRYSIDLSQIKGLNWQASGLWLLPPAGAL